jgi:hypothetical protein
MRIVLTFYRNFLWFVVGISMFGCYLLFIYGSWQFIVAVFWLKLVTNILLGLYIHIFSPEQLYFFHNLGYNKSRLYSHTFILDMIIWFLMSWITIKILL